MAKFSVTEVRAGELPTHVQAFATEQWQQAEHLGAQVLESRSSKSLDDANETARPVSCAWLCSADNTFCNPEAPNPCFGSGRCRYVCW